MRFFWRFACVGAQASTQRAQTPDKKCTVCNTGRFTSAYYYAPSTKYEFPLEYLAMVSRLLDRVSPRDVITHELARIKIAARGEILIMTLDPWCNSERYLKEFHYRDVGEEPVPESREPFKSLRNNVSRLSRYSPTYWISRTTGFLYSELPCGHLFRPRKETTRVNGTFSFLRDDCLDNLIRCNYSNQNWN